MPVSPAARKVLARHAIRARWDNCDPAAQWLPRFERQVDPDGVLDPAERAKRAREAQSVHFAELAKKSAAVRRQKAAARKAAA